MAIELPEAINAYFTADRDRDPEAVSHCFTDDAVVRDEGHDHAGRDAILQWKAQASKKYTYRVEPFSIEAQDGRTIVTSHAEGDFPGSPVDLRYAFRLRDRKISALEITL